MHTVKERASRERPAYGWDIAKLVEDKEQLRETKDRWKGLMGELPYLSEYSTTEGLNEQAEGRQRITVQVLDEHGKK